MQSINSGGTSSPKGIGTSSSSQQQQNPNFDSNVISERVKNLATQIYQELKRIISRCNYDEDILSGLMPLIVGVLESLDLALIENQQLQVELELCKDDNEQLVTMFEKEKAAKRAIDNKLIESEYAYEEERQQYQQKIESLDNIVKIFDLKTKNASDQAARFEEKEAERKKEYAKLHDRYTDLLKSHCDVVERVRHLLGNAEVAQLSSINVPQQMCKSDEVELERPTTIKTREATKSWNAEIELTLEDTSLVVIDDMLDSQSNKTASGQIKQPTQGGTTGDGSSHNDSEVELHEKEGENDSVAYTSMEKEFRKLIQENKDLLNTKNALNVVKDDLIAEVDRLTNEVCMYEQAIEQLNSTKDHMKQKVSTLDAELRKTKEELEKAKQKIRENNEEGVPYSQRKRFGRAEMAKVLMERNNYKERYMELQDAVRYTEVVRANKVETEKRSGLWKFFNNLFGAPQPLAIGAGSHSVLATSRNASPVVSYHGSPAAAALTSPSDQLANNQLVGSDSAQMSAGVLSSSIRSINQRLSSNSDLIVLMDSDLNIERGRAFRDGMGGGRANNEMPGYIHAYGWSLPASSIKSLANSTGLNAVAADLSPTGNSNASRSSILTRNSSYSAAADSFTLNSPASGSDVLSGGNVGLNKYQSFLNVPIPQCCRPLTGDSLGMKIWCATTIDLSGGYAAYGTSETSGRKQLDTSHTRSPDTSDSVVNISTSTPIKTPNTQALKLLEKEVNEALKSRASNDTIEGAIEEDSSRRQQPLLQTTTEMVMSALPVADEKEDLSSCVWICSTQHSRSKITIIDIKNKPNDMLDSFYVSTFLYCIKSISGCKMGDLLGITSVLQQANNQQKVSITLNMINELIQTQRREFYKLVEVDLEKDHKLRSQARKCSQSTSKDLNTSEDLSELQAQQQSTISMNQTKQQSLNEDDAEISRILDNNVSVGIATLQKLNDFVAHIQPQNQNESNITSEKQEQEQTESANSTSNPKAQSGSSNNYQEIVYYQPISTCLSTVWMGGKDSVLYIHSAIGQWKDCVACVKLRDSILQICHYRGRVFVALADGSLCVFFRNVESKQWEFSRYLIIDINLMVEATSDLVDLTEGGGMVDLQSKLVTQASHQISTPTHPNSSSLEHLQEIHDEQQREQSASTSKSTSPKRSSRSNVAGIRCLEVANKNLWVGYRNRILIVDPINLKLKHTFNVVPQADNQIRQLLSMKDGVFCCLRSDLILRLYSSLKPYQHIQNIDIEPVVTRLISPKTFVISHITSMKVTGNTLWIGNAHGIILTIPCQLVPQISEAPAQSGSGTGEYEESSNSLSIARFVPKCDISNAQISFHGHKDAVKFFVQTHQLMLSGGQGYLDFRLDMDDQSKSISDKSHLILWQLPEKKNH